MPNLMETYELVNELDNEAVSIIEEFMDGFQAALLENGYFACGDDRACVLANAVAKYVKDCNPILFTEPQEPRPRCLYCKSEAGLHVYGEQGPYEPSPGSTLWACRECDPV